MISEIVAHLRYFQDQNFKCMRLDGKFAVTSYRLMSTQWNKLTESDHRFGWSDEVASEERVNEIECALFTIDQIKYRI